MLDGSVSRSAGRVRIVAHLVEAAGGTTVWSDRYDRSLADVFAVQDDIAENIAAALDGTFRAVATITSDPDAYDLYLRASPRSFGPEELRSGIGLLEEATKRAYRSDPLHPMSANLVALARMAAGRVEEAIPLFEDIMARIPDMSLPFANLLRARTLLGDWQGVDQLLALAPTRPLREFEDGLDFIRTKRDPTPANLDRWRSAFEARIRVTGCVDVSRLVYTANLGLVDAAFEAALDACLGPRGADDDLMGPDACRTSLLFHAGMPELRNDPRFPRLCARLGLVEYWTASGRWPDCADAVPYDFRAECARVHDVAVETVGF